MIDVSLDIKPFTRWLNDAAAKHVPFATARTLTELAKAGQRVVRGEIDRQMTVRRPWVKQGIAVRAAQRKDGLDGMSAEVGSRDWYMADQLADASSDRKAKKGGKQFLPKGARKSKASLVPKGLRPAPVTAASKAAKPKIFFKRGRGGRSMVFQKMRGDKLRLLYTVGDVQTIKPKISLRETVGGIVMRDGEREFIKQLTTALKGKR